MNRETVLRMFAFSQVFKHQIGKMEILEYLKDIMEKFMFVGLEVIIRFMGVQLCDRRLRNLA